MNITFNSLSDNIDAVSTLSNDISAFVPSKSSKYNIFVVGDSTLAYQVSAPSKTYAHVLSAQIKNHDPDSSLFSVYRIGQSGDQARNACFNLGAHPVYLQPFTLPGDGAEVSVQVEKDNGWTHSSGTNYLPGPDICNNVINNNHTSDKPDLDTTVPFGYNQQIQFGFGVNPVTIGGIKCHMRRESGAGELSSQYIASTLYIKRLEPYGDDKTFDYPPVIHTGFEMQHTVNDVVVIFIGTNNDLLRPTGTTDMNQYGTTLITDLHEIVNSLKTDKYIIVGPYNKNTALDAGNWNNLLFKLGVEFGQHFLNELQFAVEYGLEIEGIEPTEGDLSSIEAGIMPDSFMNIVIREGVEQIDRTHMNDNGYDFLGKQIYYKGIELGYWK